MKTQIVIWDDKKYGYYTKDKVKELYDNKSYIVNAEFEDNIIVVAEAPLVIVNNKVYEAYINVIDIDNKVNIIFCYER